MRSIFLGEDMQYYYYESIYGDEKCINEVVLSILKDIKSFMDDDICFDIRLILNELLINSYEHGNKLDKKKCINLKIDINEENVYIEVSDEGKGIDKLKPYKLSDCKSNGRGLLIVKSLVDNFIVDKNNIKCNINLTP